jgi:hypothetical protein
MDNANHGCGTSMLPQPSQRHNWFAIEKMEFNMPHLMRQSGRFWPYHSHFE